MLNVFKTAWILADLASKDCRASGEGALLLFQLVVHHRYRHGSRSIALLRYLHKQERDRERERD